MTTNHSPVGSVAFGRRTELFAFIELIDNSSSFSFFAQDTVFGITSFRRHDYF